MKDETGGEVHCELAKKIGTDLPLKLAHSGAQRIVIKCSNHSRQTRQERDRQTRGSLELRHTLLASPGVPEIFTEQERAGLGDSSGVPRTSRNLQWC